MKGAFSQGTIASLAQAFFMENSQERRQSSDPYCLDPPHSQLVIFFCMFSHMGLVNIAVKPVSPTDFRSLRRSSQLCLLLAIVLEMQLVAFMVQGLYPEAAFVTALAPADCRPDDMTT